MKTLQISTDSFDNINVFTFEELKFSQKCSLHQGYKTRDDGIYWAMLHSSVLKASYTDEDHALANRLQSGKYTLTNGEIVLIEGKQYKTRYLGKYSDCAIFDPV